MNEEEKKETPKGYRIISIIALVLGIATSLCGLIVFIGTVRAAVTFPSDFDIIGMFLMFVAVVALCAFWPVFAIGLTLSIVTLFIEREMRFRLLPLAFVIVGACLISLSYAL